MVGPFCDALEGGVAVVARTIDRGAVDPNVDKHALASAASQLWPPRRRWYTAPTISLATPHECTHACAFGDADFQHVFARNSDS